MRTICVMIIVLLLAPAYASGAGGLTLEHQLSFYKDESGAGMNRPEDVMCAGMDEIVVADTGNGRLLRYIIQENKIKKVSEIRSGEMGAPIRVMSDSQGDILVLDNRRHIVRLSPDGLFKAVLDLERAGRATVIVPRSFFIGPEDDLYVLDVFGGRVLVLNKDAEFQREIPLPAHGGTISDVIVDGHGRVLIIDTVKAAVYAAAKERSEFTVLAENMGGHMEFPVSLAADSEGRLFITDRTSGSIVILAQDGSFQERLLGKGWTDGLLRHPSRVCINKKNELFVADRGNSRIQMFMIRKK